MTTLTGSPAYLTALDELTAAVRDASALAELLHYFSGQLRGDRPAPEGPPLEACPTPSQLRRALERVPVPERPGFWRQYVASDGLLNPLRGSETFSGLERAYGK